MLETDKVKENRLRRAAERQGLRLTKSRSRDPNALDFGLYALVDNEKNFLINEPLAGHWVHSWTLDEIDEYLNPPPIYVDASIPAVLEYEGRAVECLTTQEAAIAYYNLPVRLRDQAVLRVKGGARYVGGEIKRLHYGPRTGD
jgi:hypothetical protein